MQTDEPSTGLQPHVPSGLQQAISIDPRHEMRVLH
jgi:hypothetical protein